MRIIIVTIAACLMAGCTTVNDSLLNRAEAAHDLIDSVVLPKYVTHPDVTPEAAANVTAAWREYKAYLDDVAAGGDGGAE